MPRNPKYAQLLYVARNLEKIALQVDKDPKIEDLLNKIEDYLGTLSEEVVDTYLWRKFRTLRNEYKVSLIPQIIENLSKNGVNTQDNSIPVFRDLNKVKLMLEANPPTHRKMAPDKDREASGKLVAEFLDKLTSTAGPLRPLVEKLNGLDLRKEAQTVQTFIKDAHGISDTVKRVVLTASTKTGSDSALEVRDNWINIRDAAEETAELLSKNLRRQDPTDSNRIQNLIHVMQSNLNSAISRTKTSSDATKNINMIADQLGLKSKPTFMGDGVWSIAVNGKMKLLLDLDDSSWVLTYDKKIVNTGKIADDFSVDGMKSAIDKRLRTPPLDIGIGDPKGLKLQDQ